VKKPVPKGQCRDRAHWITLTCRGLATAPAWGGQELEVKGQTGAENGPLWLEGKAELMFCHLSALILKVKA